MSQVNRLLFLADQPWQLELVSKIVSELAGKCENTIFAIAAVDNYMILHARDALKMAEKCGVEKVFTLETFYRSWQVLGEPVCDPKVLKEWEANHCRNRTLDELARTNQWVYGNERGRYYLPISEKWEKRILQDSISWVDSLVEEFKPTTVVSIERSTLPTNLLYTLCQSLGIPFLTFITTRVGSRWNLRHDFGFGMTKELELSIRTSYSSISETLQARELASRIVLNRTGSYDSLEQSESEMLLDSQSKPFRKLILDLLAEWRLVYGRFVFEKRRRFFKVRRVEQNLLKLTFVHFWKILLSFLWSIGVYNYAHKELPYSPFFFWAMHSRPEGSVLVLGKGVDEIQEIHDTANHLPAGTILVVKENVEMFGLRSHNFYKTLRNNRRIWLLDSTYNTFDAIRECRGVIGISGTVLLESKLMKKPVWSRGFPEFLPFLDHQGPDGEGYFQKIADENYLKESYDEFMKYLQYVLDNSNELDIPNYHYPLTDSSSEMTIQRFAEAVKKELKLR